MALYKTEILKGKKLFRYFCNEFNVITKTIKNLKKSVIIYYLYYANLKLYLGKRNFSAS